MRELLEAGVHFGHQTKRWNPKMKKYIFGERNGIYIIDLQKTLKLFREASAFISNLAASGGVVLFVGTKKQGRDAIKEAAERGGMFYINQRWLGGMLTNFATVHNSVKKLNKIEGMKAEGMYDTLLKKEALVLEKKRLRLEKSFSGIKEMSSLPDALFVIDSRKEKIAISEARKMGIPIVALVDTNCNPDEVDYVIPGNDDAIRAINLITSKIVEAALEGKNKLKGVGEAAVEEAAVMDKVEAAKEEITDKAAVEVEAKSEDKSMAKTKEQGSTPAEVVTEAAKPKAEGPEEAPDCKATTTNSA